MNKIAAYLLSVVLGIAAWHVAAWGNTQNFWPKIGCWFLFWLLLTLYYRAEKDHNGED